MRNKSKIALLIFLILTFVFAIGGMIGVFADEGPQCTHNWVVDTSYCSTEKCTICGKYRRFGDDNQVGTVGFSHIFLDYHVIEKKQINGCQTNVKYEYRCNYCGKSNGQKTKIDTSDPVWGDWTSSGYIDSETGKHFRTCKNCNGEVEGHREEEKHDVKYEKDSASPALKHTVKCEKCGEVGQEDHRYDASHGDEHICLLCNLKNNTYPHHGFGNGNCAPGTKCDNPQCKAELVYTKLEGSAYDQIMALGTKSWYHVSDSSVKWTNGTPSGQIYIEFSPTPYSSQDSSEASPEVSLKYGSYNHHDHRWHQNQNAFDSVDRNGDTLTNTEWAAKQQAYGETIDELLNAHGQDAHLESDYAKVMADWTNDAVAVFRGKVGVDVDSQDDLDLNSPLSDFSYYKQNIDGLDGAGSEIAATGSGRVFTIAVNGLPDHGFISGLKIGGSTYNPWGEERLWCPGHGGGPSNIPGFVSIGYRDTNGNIIEGAPGDTIKLISNVYNGHTESFTGEYKNLNNLGWRYVGYIVYSEKDLTNKYKSNNYKVVGKNPDGTDKVVLNDGNGKNEGHTGILSPILLRDNFKKFLNDKGYTSTTSISGQVKLSYGDRSKYVVFVFEPVKVTVKHMEVADGYDKLDTPRLINTNLNTSYYLPFIKLAKYHGYEEGLTGHKHIKIPCSGKEGEVITHLNKTLDKYLYPMYVLDGVTISRVGESQGGLYSKTYKLRKDGEEFNSDTHTTEYSKDNNIRLKMISLATDLKVESWNKNQKDKTKLGKIPDIEIEFDYSGLIVNINHILMKSKDEKKNLDNTLNNPFTPIPARLTDNQKDGTFRVYRDSRALSGYYSLSTAQFETEGKAKKGDTSKTYQYKYPGPGNIGEKLRYSLFKDDGTSPTPKLYTYSLETRIETTNKKGQTSLTKLTIIPPNEFGKINSELRSKSSYMFNGQRDIPLHSTMKYEDALNKTLEGKEVDLTFYYYEQYQLNVEYRDITTGNVIVTNKGVSPIVFDGTNPITEKVIKNLKPIRYDYVHCTLDIDHEEHTKNRLENIYQDSDKWIDDSTPLYKAFFDKDVTVEYNGKNRTLIVWYEPIGNQVITEYYEIVNYKSGDRVETVSVKAKTKLIEGPYTVTTLKDTISVDAQIKHFEELGYLYNTRNEKDIGYVVYTYRSGKPIAQPINGATMNRTDLFDITFIDGPSGDLPYNFPGQKVLVRFFFIRDPESHNKIRIECRDIENQELLLDAPILEDLNFDENTTVIRKSLEHDHQYWDYQGYDLYNKMVKKNKDVTESSRDITKKFVDVRDNGNDRLLIWWFKRQPGIPDDLLNIYGQQKLLDGIFNTDVILKSNTRDDEQYDVVKKSIPTSEDLYGNVITSSYLLEDYAASTMVSPDLFRVYFVLKYRDNANEKNEGYRLAVKAVDLKFDYFYLSGRNTKVRPLHHAVIKNSAIRSWSKNTSTDWLFNTANDKGPSATGEEVDQELWLYPNWNLENFRIDYQQGGRLHIKEDAKSDTVTKILNKYKALNSNGNYKISTDITIDGNNDKLISALKGGVYNVESDKSGNGSYSLVYVIDRDEVYATTNDLGSAHQQAAATLEQFYEDSVHESVMQFLQDNQVKVETDKMIVYSPDNPKGDIVYSGALMDLDDDQQLGEENYLLYNIFNYNPAQTNKDRLYFTKDIYVDKDTANGTYNDTYADIYFKDYLQIGKDANGLPISQVVADPKVDIEPKQGFKNQKGNRINVHTPVINNSKVIPGNFVNQKLVIQEKDNFAYVQLDGTFTVEFPWEGTHGSDNYKDMSLVYSYAREKDSKNAGNTSKPGFGSDGTNWAQLYDVRVPFDTYLHLDSTTNVLIRANNWVSDELFRYVKDNKLSIKQIMDFYNSFAMNKNDKNTRFTFTIPVWVEETAYVVETRVIAENAFDYINSETYKTNYTGNGSKDYLKLVEQLDNFKDASGTIERRQGKRVVDDADSSLVNKDDNYNKSPDEYTSYNRNYVEVVGKIYDLEIVKLTDPDWSAFQQGNTTTGGGHGRRNPAPSGTLPAEQLPGGITGQNVNTTYRYAPKLGYSFAFSFKTKGRKSNRIDISVLPNGFRFVPKAPGQESNPQIVDLYYRPQNVGPYVKIDGVSDGANLMVAMADDYLKADPVERTNSTRIYPVEKLSKFIPNNVPYNYQTKVNIGKFSGLSLPHYMRLTYNNFNEYVAMDGKAGLYKRQVYDEVSNDANLTKKIYENGAFANETPSDYVIGSVGHWYAAYTLPISTVAVPRGLDVNNPANHLKNGYIMVSFGIKTQYDPSESSDGTTKYDYLIYTGPETSVNFSTSGDLPEEQIKIEWNYVIPGNTTTGGGHGRRSGGLTSNNTTGVPTNNPALIKPTQTEVNGETYVDSGNRNAVLNSNSYASEGSTEDRIYNNRTGHNNNLLPAAITNNMAAKIYVVDANGRGSYKEVNIPNNSASAYYNKNVITDVERAAIELTDSSGKVLNAKQLADKGYYKSVTMADLTKTFLPANSIGGYESDYTAQRDVGIGISQ